MAKKNSHMAVLITLILRLLMALIEDAFDDNL